MGGFSGMSDITGVSDISRTSGGPGKGSDGRMKVAFRYCGGCNPRYDRGALVKRLTGKHPEWDAEIAAEGTCYDLLIVVGGCSSCCAAWEQFTADRVVKVWTDLDDLPEESFRLA